LVLPLPNPPLSTFKPKIPAGSVPLTGNLEGLEKEYRKQRKAKGSENAGCMITGFIVLIVAGGLIFGLPLGNYPEMLSRCFG
jgi:hypothetical protein